MSKHTTGRERLTDCAVCRRPMAIDRSVPGWVVFACRLGHCAIGWAA